MTAKRQQAEDDLRSTSDAIVEDAQRVAALERTKQRLPAEDPALRVLSSEVEGLTERMRRASALERSLVGEIASDDGASVH